MGVAIVNVESRQARARRNHRLECPLVKPHADPQPQLDQRREPGLSGATVGGEEEEDRRR